MTLIGGGGELITVLLIYYWQNPPQAEAASAVREKELQEQRLVKLMLSIALVIVSTTAGIAGLRLVSLLSGTALWSFTVVHLGLASIIENYHSKY